LVIDFKSVKEYLLLVPTIEIQSNLP
jgi:hypothetical protein